MYESPIKIIESTIDSIYKDIVKKKDDAIFAEIQSSFGVDLDREELLRALQFDRDQYEKGYADGKADAAPKWIPVSERLPEHPEYDWVLVQVKMNPEDYYGVPHIAELRNGTWYDEDDLPLEEFRIVKVTHWMPLPEPPKED